MCSPFSIVTRSFNEVGLFMFLCGKPSPSLRATPPKRGIKKTAKENSGRGLEQHIYECPTYVAPRPNVRVMAQCAIGGLRHFVPHR